MTLSFQVEILHILRIIDTLGVNFIVTLDDRLPDFFFHLFEVDVEVLVILNVPERVVYLDTLMQITIDQRLFLALDHDFQVLGLDFTQNLACLSACWQLDLHIDIEHLLGPLVLLRGSTIIGRNGLVNFDVCARRQWVFGCHLSHLLSRRRSRCRCGGCLCGGG